MKALTTNMESVSSQRLFQFFEGTEVFKFEFIENEIDIEFWNVCEIYLSQTSSMFVFSYLNENRYIGLI